MPKVIVKVQLPLDFKKTRIGGKPTVDDLRKPIVLIYSERMHLRGRADEVADKSIWEKMKTTPDDVNQTAYSVKAYFHAEKIKGRWVLGDKAPSQAW